jgi:hypothetical protein
MRHAFRETFPLSGKAHPERIRRATLTVGGNSQQVPSVFESSDRIDLGLDTVARRAALSENQHPTP